MPFLEHCQAWKIADFLTLLAQDVGPCLTSLILLTQLVLVVANALEEFQSQVTFWQVHQKENSKLQSMKASFAQMSSAGM